MISAHHNIARPGPRGGPSTFCGTMGNMFYVTPSRGWSEIPPNRASGRDSGSCEPFKTLPLLPPLKVSPSSAYLHDTIRLYAQTVREMIQAGRDFRDGRQLVGTLKGSNQTALQGKWLDCWWVFWTQACSPNRWGFETSGMWLKACLTLSHSWRLKSSVRGAWG